MVIKRWKKEKLKLAEFNDLISKIQSISSYSKTIVFTYDNTGVHFLGIKNATIGMFPKNTIVLPQTYGNSKLSKKQTDELFANLKKFEIKEIIFSGNPNYIYNWLLSFHKEFKMGVIYHGGLAEITGDLNRQKRIKMLIDYANRGIIEKIGIIKEGLDYWFENVTKAKVYRVIPELSIPESLNINKFNDGRIHIGIFGNSSYNKNRHTQVVAASLIKNSVIHILAPNEFSYALPEDRIIVHKNLSRVEFLELLGSMDINLYCSYSESWGQVVLESFYLEVPCLFSNNSGLENYVGKECMVDSFDNPKVIANRITETLNLNVPKLKIKDLVKQSCINDIFLT